MEPVFMAQIMLFGGNFAPRGWAFCDGQLLPISQNQALFSLLGTIYGGDGRTTFALPDLRSRVGMHPGTGPGLSTRREGQRLGTDQNFMSTLQLPAHGHLLSTGTIVGNIMIGVNEEDPGTDSPVSANLGTTTGGPGGNGHTTYNTEGASANEVLNGAAANLQPSGMSGNVGASLGINNIAPSLGINYIIALQGPFPSRS